MSDFGALEFFFSIPDEILVEIAKNDWEALEKLCIALTLDLQLIRETQAPINKIKSC